MMTRSPVEIPRPSLTKSEPSVHCRGMRVPMSCGFLTAFIDTPAAPFWARRGALLLSTGLASFQLPRALVAGAAGAKADTPGSDETEKASVQPRKATAARIGAT
jgi:hypothetical protein